MRHGALELVGNTLLLCLCSPRGPQLLHEPLQILGEGTPLGDRIMLPSFLRIGRVDGQCRQRLRRIGEHRSERRGGWGWGRRRRGRRQG